MSAAQPPLFPAAPDASPDPQLEEVRAAILAADPHGEKFSAALRRTFDMLLDGQHTGRFRWEQLHKTEKTHAGTLVEINLQRAFGFADGDKMDYSIAGADVDCKYSQDIGKWMIPPEAMGHLCLGVWASDKAGIWSAGLFRVVEEVLTKKEGNRDGKRSLTAAARETAVHWLFRDEPLQENILLRLSQEDIDAIFAPKHGTQRVHELFRRTQGRVVSRSVVATVAQQDDYMKRVRYNGGSRSALRPEGIVILGQYGNHQAVAQALGLPEPGAGESVSVRLAPWTPEHADVPWAELEGGKWVVARDGDPKAEAPMLPER
ncbi:MULTISPECIES: NaeI family type II restriction endonuclease [unclassified Streptomyces]|uniref:NaeI family type II restriction endonuclease n=1 Tax=unclassified Streptomyces TaxID=2593676 RepID=UPI0003822ED0|nr:MULTISPECIES: NaeI family type II restriction endonuclease [unclassified Streptomyces]MYX34360.1 restriction endonuclease [Streptomyces sp. SID8377]